MRFDRGVTPQELKEDHHTVVPLPGCGVLIEVV
jgi:hypothetical protein